MGVSGGTKARADRVVEVLRQAGVDARALADAERGGNVRLRWLAPGEAAAPSGS